MSAQHPRSKPPRETWFTAEQFFLLLFQTLRFWWNAALGAGSFSGVFFVLRWIGIDAIPAAGGALAGIVFVFGKIGLQIAEEKQRAAANSAEFIGRKIDELYERQSDKIDATSKEWLYHVQKNRNS